MTRVEILKPFFNPWTEVEFKSRLGFWMAMSLVKINRLGFFTLLGSGLQILMIINFVKSIIFVHLNLGNYLQCQAV